MKTPHTRAFAIATLLGLGLGAAWSASPRAPRPAPPGLAAGQSGQADLASPVIAGQGAAARALPGRRWQPGEAFLYAMDSDRSLTIKGSGAAAREIRTRLRGTLVVAVVSEDAEGLGLRGELREVGLEQAPGPGSDLARGLRVPFHFSSTRQGTLGAFVFAREVPPEARSLLKALASSLQIVAPPAPQAGWRALEQDSAGEYEASYQLDGGSLQKTRGAYLRVYGARGLVPLTAEAGRTDRGTSDIMMDDSGWPRAVTEQSSSAFSAQGMSVEGATKIVAQLASTERHPEWVGAVASADAEPFAMDPARARQSADRSLIGAMTYQEVATGLAAGDDHTRGQNQSRMAAFFRVHPASVAQAKEDILHGEMDTNARKRLTAALGTAGTPEAQAVLASILGSSEASVIKKLDAGIALGLSKSPTAETAAALKEAMSSPDKVVASTATLGTGIVARTWNASGAGDTKEAVDLLLVGLQNATTESDRILYLQALGNTGDPRALAAMLACLTDPSAEIRATVVASLRFMNEEEATRAILAALGDADLSLRKAAVTTLATRPIVPVMAAVEALLKKEPEEALRLAIVNALKQKLQEDESVIELLTWALTSDPSPAVRTLARQVLGKDS